MWCVVVVQHLFSLLERFKRQVELAPLAFEYLVERIVFPKGFAFREEVLRIFHFSSCSHSSKRRLGCAGFLVARLLRDRYASKFPFMVVALKLMVLTWDADYSD